MLEVGARPDPEDGSASWTHEREAPLRGDRRDRERLRDRDAVGVGLLFLCTPLDHASVRRRPDAQEIALAAGRLQQDDLAIGQRCRKRNPGHSAAGTDVDDRPLECLHTVEPAQGVLEQRCASLLGVLDRRQARCLDEGFQPALKPLIPVAAHKG